MDSVTCLCSNVRRAALALTARYDDALAPHGLKVTQLSLLHAVKRREAPNLTELAEATGLDRSTLGRNLRLLEAAGLVALSLGGDQRDRRAALTEAGRTQLRAATRTWAALQDELGAALGPDAERLVAVSRRVTELARAPATRPGLPAAAEGRTR
jgi:DNA-binding MarR family transcriptional regulator